MIEPFTLGNDEMVRRIKEALELDRRYSYEEVMHGLGTGRFQPFCNKHGTWITEIVVHKAGKTINVFIVAGELPGVMELQPRVEEFGRANGCTDMAAIARPGWRSVAVQHGWHTESLIIAKSLAEKDPSSEA
jgi:hypothetical protein